MEDIKYSEKSLQFSNIPSRERLNLAVVAVEAVNMVFHLKVSEHLSYRVADDSLALKPRCRSFFCFTATII